VAIRSVWVADDLGKVNKSWAGDSGMSIPSRFIAGLVRPTLEPDYAGQADLHAFLVIGDDGGRERACLLF